MEYLNPFTIYVFEIKESIANIYIIYKAMPGLSGLEKLGQLPVQIVLGGTD